MTEIAVKIGAKQGANGITDDLAERLHSKALTSFIAVVEFHVEETSERIRDGKETIKLSIGNLEVADEPTTEDAVRQIQRSLYQRRKLNADDAQLSIETREDLEPTVEQVVAANPGLLPHEYAAGTLDGECDVCGHEPGDALHQPAEDLVNA